MAELSMACDTSTLQEDGNCILLAIAYLTGRYADANTLAIEPLHPSVKGLSPTVRTYRSCLAGMRVSAEPLLDFDSRQNGEWLIHTNHDGRPHCIAVRVIENACNCYVGDCVYTIDVPTFVGVLTTCIDRRSMVYMLSLIHI